MSANPLRNVLLEIARAGMKRPKDPIVICEPCFDGEGYTAWDDRIGLEPDAPRGWGLTRQSAINDFLDAYESRFGDDKSERDDSYDEYNGRDWE